MTKKILVIVYVLVVLGISLSAKAGNREYEREQTERAYNATKTKVK